MAQWRAETHCWEIWLKIHFNNYLIVVVLDYILFSYIIVRVQWNLNFPEIVSKNTHMSNFTQIGPVSAELFYVGRWTEVQTDRQTWRG
jgi:hypothetical protein